MKTRQYIGLGSFFILAVLLYVVYVTTYEERMVKEVDGISEISFIERYRVLNGDVWVQFKEKHEHWRRTAKTVSIYLSNKVDSSVTLVVADGRQITLAPRIGGLCMITASKGKITSTTCEEK
jgi:hypothetical protein